MLMKMLLIEDEGPLAAEIARALKLESFVVDQAFDGENGRLLGATGRYEACVLDLGLPKMPGLAVLSAWRGRWRQDAGIDPHRARRVEREGRRL